MTLEEIFAQFEPAGDVTATALAKMYGSKGQTLPVNELAHVATISLAVSARRIADALESVVDPSYDLPAVRTRENR